jgi:DNA topoisomerase-1
MTSRIAQLKIPPNWKNVTVAKSPLDYLQATGYDAKGKMQYLYHPLFILLTTEDKYMRLKEFIGCLPIINKKLTKDFNAKCISPEDTRKKMIAFLFKLLQKTFIRIGNQKYVRDNHTYGLTTLEKRHFKIVDKGILISFVGKRSISHNVLVDDPFLVKNLKVLLKKAPLGTSPVFCTKDSEGNLECIKATEMNEYLQEINEHFTYKDFRTYYSNLLFIEKLQKVPIESPQKNLTKVVNHVYDYVADKFGHTKNISKKAYIIPHIAEAFIENPGYFKNKTPENLLRALI